MEMTLSFSVDDIKNRDYIPTFQPIINLQNQDIVGLEANGNLCMENDRHIPVSSFYQYTEENNLSWFVDMKTLVVAGEAFNAIRRHYKEAYHIKLHINLTSSYLDDPKIVHESINTTLIGIAQKGKGFLSPTDITLELSNDFPVVKFSDFQDTLQEFKKNGYSLIIEDYAGTGAGMVYLRDQLPIDGIKLDEVFIHGIDGNSKKLSQLNDIVNTAEKEEINIIANGIHTESERKLIDQCMTIQYGQGRYEDIGGEMNENMIEYKIQMLRLVREQEKRSINKNNRYNIGFS